MNTKALAILNVLAFAIVITINALANILPINGMNTGQVSALYPSMFTPAGFTFSIWSVIYLLLLGFVGLQWRLREKPYFRTLSVWFLVSCAANATWIIAWHYLYVNTSLVIMVVLLLSLIRLFLLLQPQQFSMTETLFIRVAFTIYFSWICVATIANFSAVLVAAGWSGDPLSAATWTMLLILIAALLSVFITLRYKAPAYVLVTIWALFGIYSRWAGSDQSFITITALVSMGILAFTFLFSIIRLRSSKPGTAG